MQFFPLKVIARKGRKEGGGKINDVFLRKETKQSKTKNKTKTTTKKIIQ